MGKTQFVVSRFIYQKTVKNTLEKKLIFFEKKC